MISRWLLFITMLGAALVPRATPAQEPKSLSGDYSGAHILEPASPETKSNPSSLTPQPRIQPQKPAPPSRPARVVFFALSGGVYGAAVADMYQTLEVRHNYWWYERDPLARPFARWPAPAYYTAGLAMATGVNWLSWRMLHSRRWRKFAFIPQALSIGGNVYGFKSNDH